MRRPQSERSSDQHLFVSRFLNFAVQFPNCLTYATKEEFVAELYYAITHAPEPLSEEYAYALSWEAATQRLEAAGCIPKAEYDKMQTALSSEEAGIEVSVVHHSFFRVTRFDWSHSCQCLISVDDSMR
jgi:hypothetical protein